jgi:hypothetical protein
VFVIRSLSERDDETGDPLYWSSHDRWVDRASATRFPDATGSLPIGGAV